MNDAIAVPPNRIEELRQSTVLRALRLEIETGMRRSSRGRSTLALANEITGRNDKNKRTAYEALNKHIVETYGQQFDRPLS